MKDSYSFETINICRMPNGVIVVLPYEHVVEQSNGYLYIGKNTEKGIRWGIMIDFKVIVDPIYEAIGPCSDGMIAVKLNSKWGYLDKLGKLVIEPIYEVAGVFMYDIAKVAIVAGKEFYINKKGRKLKTDDDDAY